MLNYIDALLLVDYDFVVFKPNCIIENKFSSWVKTLQQKDKESWLKVSLSVNLINKAIQKGFKVTGSRLQGFSRKFPPWPQEFTQN